MKKYLITILALVLGVLKICSQSVNQNYIKTTVFKNGFQQGNINLAQDFDKMESILYYDGLGRPIQNIAVRAGGNSEDIIIHIGYDDYGRQDKEYLPYATTTNGGLFRTDALSTTGSFYNTAKYENTLNPYSEKNLEASPLNRVLEQGAPGTDWAVNKTSDADHTIKFGYQTNVANEVLKFEIVFPSGDTSLPQLQLPDSHYAPGELYKTVTKDENWKAYDNKDHTTEEFKDKQERIVLKRTYDNQQPHDTYYIYDDYGNLTYVLPPLASQKTKFYETGMVTYPASHFVIGGSPTGNLTIGVEKTGVNTYRFVADFDLHNLGSSVFKQGALMDFNADPSLGDYVYLGGDNTYEYDGDTEFEADIYYYLRNGKLNCDSYFYSYDYLADEYESGYPAPSYLFPDLDWTRTMNLPNTLEGITEVETQSNLQDVLDDLCYQYKYDERNRLVEKKLPGKGWEYIVYNDLDQPVLTQDAKQRISNQWAFTKYDAFGRVAYTGLFIDGDGFSRTQMPLEFSGSTVFEAKLSASQNINNVPIYYSNTAMPVESSTIEILTINYYDAYVDLPTGLGVTVTTYYGLGSSTKTKGLSTISKVRVLDTNDWITTVTYYDDRGRLIYAYSENEYLNTIDIIESKLDFTGKVLETKTTHKKTGKPDIVTMDVYGYDHMERLISHKQNINGQGEELIAKNHYDELGQLVGKDVGDTETNPLQKIDYTYNIRGWLKKLNNPVWGELGDALFSFEIGYNDKGTRLYNGNISEFDWVTVNDESYRRYNYYYDDLNRLKNANYYEWSKDSRFNVYLNYDKNGNILSLTRKGAIVENPDYGVAGDYGNMDVLSYAYEGNQLMQVSDSGSSLTGFKDGNTSGNDYSYDANGNMVKDLNKGIGTATLNGITYNHLNLPDEVKFDNNNDKRIKYIYDAMGVKLGKLVYNNSSTPTTTVEYAGNYVYENGSLKFFNHPEGYVDAENGYGYVYQYKDYLGNIRLNYKENTNYQEIPVWTDGFESASGWDGSGNTWGSAISAFDSTFKRTGNYSGRLDPQQTDAWATATHSNHWESINISEPTYYTISAWVYLEDVPDNFAGMYLFMNTNGETGYFTDINTLSTKVKGQWLELKKTVLVQPYIDQLNVRLDNRYAGKVWFDDVQILKGNSSRTEILEENNYYPFGLKHKGYNNVINSTNIALNWKFGGKEYNEELGLDWYDITSRNYDPSLGRWMNLDPLAEKFTPVSPYIYSANSPLRFIDPDGKDIINVTGGVKFTGYDAQIAFRALQQSARSNSNIHLVYEDVTPNIYKHTLNAFQKGKPKLLHYDPDKKRQSARRRLSTWKYPSRYVEGLERDEYPYASTFEGGLGAEVAYVPSGENSSQGGSLRALYANMKLGDEFLVLPVPSDREPEAVPEPVEDPVYTPDDVPDPVIPIIPVPATNPKPVPGVLNRVLQGILNRIPVFIITPPLMEQQLSPYGNGKTTEQI